MTGHGGINGILFVAFVIGAVIGTIITFVVML